MLPVVAAACAALAAWVAQGTAGVAAVNGGRIALLPLTPRALLVAAAAGAIAAVTVRRSGSASPLLLLVLLLLPWIPGAPAVFSLWHGPLALLVWAAIAAILLVRVIPRVTVARPALAAGVIGALVYGLAAWQVNPSVPAGDERHYLVITQSLLLDRDLRIENNHWRGDYHAYFAGALQPDYVRRGRDREIYSIHAPGLSALVAPAFALGGYRAVVVFLVLAAAVGSALTWHVAWRATGDTRAAWFAWAAVSLSVSAVFHSFTVYPDGLGGLVALTGLWALIRARDEARTGAGSAVPWVLHGAALALLPWLHTRFALIAGGFGAVILWRLATTKNAAAKASGFLVVPALSALAWVGFFVAIYGTPDPSAPYGGQAGSFVHVPGGLVGLLFDQRFGLLAYAPVLAFGFAGLAAAVARAEHRRLALELLFVIVPYLLVVTHFAMWWGGHSAPARFFVPVLPLMAVPCAFAWTSMRRRATKATAWAALGFAVFATAALVFVDGGRLAYNTRDAHAAWLEWLNPGLDLGRGLPAFWRGRDTFAQTSRLGWGEEETGIYRDAAVWIAVLLAAWYALRWLQRSRLLHSRAAFATATAAVYAGAAMIAFATVWALAGAKSSNSTGAQIGLLRRLGSESPVFALDVSTLRRIRAADVPPKLRLTPPRARVQGGAGRNDRPLYVLPAMPAGQYRLRLYGTGDGLVMLGIGRDQFSIRTEAISAGAAPLTITFPVDVRGLVVRGDDALRRGNQSMTIEPVSIASPRDRLAEGAATRAIRYDAGSLYFMDEESFPEPEAFWVAGSRESRVVLQPDAARPEATLLLRNGPVANRLTIRCGEWRDEVSLAPGEERRVQVPVDPRRGAAALTLSSSSGFRPSEADPSSRDGRFLGVWVKPLGP